MKSEVAFAVSTHWFENRSDRAMKNEPYENLDERYVETM